MNNLNNTELALKYILGNKDAANILLNRFNNLIIAFADLLYYGDIIESPTINNFLDLLTNSNCKNRKESICKNIMIINERYSSFDYQDVLQDIRLAFLNFIMNFDPDKLTKDFEYKFESYVLNNFHYIIKKETIDKIVDIPIYCSGELDIDNFPGSQEIENIMFSINDSWVEGTTCSDVFTNLTKEERKLIRQRFVNEMAVKDIADLNGVTPSAISHKLNKIKEKIKN
ncbi:MAG: sigma-70 family RNA polymerase sigma factor [bacterium]